MVEAEGLEPPVFPTPKAGGIAASRRLDSRSGGI